MKLYLLCVCLLTACSTTQKKVTLIEDNGKVEQISSLIKKHSVISRDSFITILGLDSASGDLKIGKISNGKLMITEEWNFLGYNIKAFGFKLVDSKGGLAPSIIDQLLDGTIVNGVNYTQVRKLPNFE